MNWTRVTRETEQKFRENGLLRGLKNFEFVGDELREIVFAHPSGTRVKIVPSQYGSALYVYIPEQPKPRPCLRGTIQVSADLNVDVRSSYEDQAQAEEAKRALESAFPAEAVYLVIDDEPPPSNKGDSNRSSATAAEIPW